MFWKDRVYGLAYRVSSYVMAFCMGCLSWVAMSFRTALVVMLIGLVGTVYVWWRVRTWQRLDLVATDGIDRGLIHHQIVWRFIGWVTSLVVGFSIGCLVGRYVPFAVAVGLLFIAAWAKLLTHHHVAGSQRQLIGITKETQR